MQGVRGVDLPGGEANVSRVGADAVRVGDGPSSATWGVGSRVGADAVEVGDTLSPWQAAATIKVAGRTIHRSSRRMELFTLKTFDAEREVVGVTYWSEPSNSSTPNRPRW